MLFNKEKKKNEIKFYRCAFNYMRIYPVPYESVGKSCKGEN